MYVVCTIALDYVDWIWHRLNTDCWSGSHDQEKRGVNYTLNNLGRVAWYKQCDVSRFIVSVLHFVYVDLYANGYIPTLYSRLGFSVGMTTSV